MIEIKKQKEPPKLVAHKKKKYATYTNMPMDVHQAVLESLMREQGFICAYCMRKIPQKGKEPAVTIEHIEAQSSTDIRAALDYRNMLAVCNGNRGNAENAMTCDARRKNVPLTVNPLKPSTLLGIQYKPDGMIFSTDENVNRDLTVTLNLNCNDFGLVDCRRDALQKMLAVLKEKHSSGDIKLYCAKLLKTYKEESTKIPYVGILIYWLEKHC